MLSAPTSTAPAASSRAISVASALAGGRSRLILEPASVGRPGDVEQVLDGERHAGQRPERLALRARRIDRARLGERALARDGGEGVEHAVALGDARERRLDHGQRARLAGCDGRRDLGC